MSGSSNAMNDSLNLCSWLSWSPEDDEDHEDEGEEEKDGRPRSCDTGR